MKPHPFYSATTAAILSWAFSTSLLPAQEPLQELLNDAKLSGQWIYGDVARATAEAQRTGKPMLILFRCVPCQCASALDKQIAAGDAAFETLLQNFVCVRVVQMNGVDVNRFQFDRDLSLAVLFMNADGTVYGRYGTRASPSRTENTHISWPSFVRAVERSLELHRAYPANKPRLVAKRSVVSPPRTPEAMPHLRPFRGKQQVQNCVHCHMVGEADLKERSLQGRLTESDIWSYPLPENLGLRMELDDGLIVKSIRADSPASRIGLQPGDELVALDGQQLISQADIQWVLHHAPLAAKLPVQFRRDGRLHEEIFNLRDGWKKTDMYWRSSLTGLRYGLHLQKASSGEREKLGLGPERMALVVRYSFENAGRAGIRNGDIIVSVNGRNDLLTESELLAYFHLTRPAPREVKVEYSRKGEMGSAVMRLDSPDLK